MIHYTLADSALRPGEYRAFIMDKGLRRLGDFFDYCRKRRISEGQAVDVLDSMAAWILKSVETGQEVDFGALGRTRLGLRAPGAQPGEALDPAKATLTVSWQVSAALRKQAAGRAREVGFEQSAQQLGVPGITQVLEGLTGTQDRYAPGAIVEITGQRLKFNPQHEDEGVFLEAVGAAPVRASHYRRNGPRRIHALVPPHLKGPLRLTVRTRGRSKDTLRAAKYEKRLRPLRTIPKN